MEKCAKLKPFSSFLLRQRPTLGFQFKTMSYFVVPTSDGTVKGKSAKTKTNFPYYAFYKIPFAKPPVGDLRQVVN
jgi:hypothetical protein